MPALMCNEEELNAWCFTIMEHAWPEWEQPATALIQVTDDQVAREFIERWIAEDLFHGGG